MKACLGQRLKLILATEFNNFPAGSDGKVSAYNVGDLGPIPGSGRSPGEVNGYLRQYFCLGNPSGQRSLAGYSPLGHTESGMT